MSTRPRFQPIQVLSSATMATSQISIPSIIIDASCPSYSYTWSGTSPVGTVAVQVSNDYSQNGAGQVSNAGTWTSIYFTLNGGSTQVNSAPVTGNTGTGFIDVPITGAYAIRTIYTATSGTGTITATFSAKVT